VSSDPLLASLRAAVAASPDDVALRVHLAHLLMKAGLHTEAIVHAAGALTRDPGCTDASVVIAEAGLGRPALPHQSIGPQTPPPQASAPQLPVPQAARPLTDDEILAGLEAGFAAPAAGRRAATTAAGVGSGVGDAAEADTPAQTAAVVVEPGLRLADIGGMDDVKARLDASYLAPMRDPELRELYRSTLRGGLLLYGPPGCGKTTIARALAGELGAGFLAVSLADVLDSYADGSERNVQEVFRLARQHAPCVLFLDDVDAVGARRSQLPYSGTRGAVNQLLTELDGNGVHSGDVHVLAATDRPWDVDGVLRRPGRLDRMMLVTPPDPVARETILAAQLADRPVAGLDLFALAGATEGYTCADLAHLVATATERALLDSARSGAVRPIGMPDLGAALHDVRPSTGPWLDVARNVAQFSNDGGIYDDLAAYLRARGRR
jgi:AAA+ superfamily predicted ATPase